MNEGIHIAVEIMLYKNGPVPKMTVDGNVFSNTPEVQKEAAKELVSMANAIYKELHAIGLTATIPEVLEEDELLEEDDDDDF